MTTICNTFFFIADITEKEFKTEEDLHKITERYPSRTILFVTGQQKITISDFSGNTVRWIDITGEPFYSDKDCLVWTDELHSGRDYLIMTAYAIERLGVLKYKKSK